MVGLRIGEKEEKDEKERETKQPVTETKKEQMTNRIELPTKHGSMNDEYCITGLCKQRTDRVHVIFFSFAVLFNNYPLY